MRHPGLDSDPMNFFHSSLLVCGFYLGLSLAASAQSGTGLTGISEFPDSRNLAKLC
jgi:hypothetical protein